MTDNIHHWFFTTALFLFSFEDKQIINRNNSYMYTFMPFHKNKQIYKQTNKTHEMLQCNVSRILTKTIGIVMFFIYYLNYQT